MAEDHAEGKTMQLGEVIRGLMHEMRGALSIVTQGIQYLETMSEEQAEDQQQVLGLMAKSAKRLGDLMDGLARLAEPIRARRSAVPLLELIHSALGELNGALAGKEIIVEKKVPENLPAIHGDRSLLVEAIRALLSNAIQAMPSGGRLTFEAAAVPSGVECAIVDTGGGIREEKLARVFDPFFTTRPTTESLGIGLSMVRAIVEAHEGSIEIKSRLGKGTRVIIRLPMTPSTKHSVARDGTSRSNQEDI